MFKEEIWNIVPASRELTVELKRQEWQKMKLFLKILQDNILQMHAYVGSIYRSFWRTLEVLVRIKMGKFDSGPWAESFWMSKIGTE